MSLAALSRHNSDKTTAKGCRMAKHVTANGVATWYEQVGQGDPVVLLHGGMTDSRDFAGNLHALGGQFQLFLPERRGHGHTPDVAGPITIELMAQDTIAFLESVVRGPAHLVGYSAGATVALRVAGLRPDLVNRLVLISCAFDSDGMIVKPTADAEPPPQLVAAYGEVSPDGSEHLRAVIAKIARAVAEEPGLTPANLGAVRGPVLVMAADDDIVTLEHTVALYNGLAGGQLAIVPAASHLLLSEWPELCTGMVTTFLTTDPAPTMMPIRRAASTPSTQQ
jgi:pimeloyl-ACP methyl ester carboxylesterase